MKRRRRKAKRSTIPPPAPKPMKPIEMTFTRDEQAMLDRAFSGYSGGGARSPMVCKISTRPR